MATQGIVSIRLNGSMFFKVVAGSNGFNVGKLVERVKAHQGLMTIADVYRAAEQVKFGASSDLIVQASDGSLAYDTDAISEEDLGTLYHDHQKFLDPRFNPRWDVGLAEYIEVVDLS